MAEIFELADIENVTDEDGNVTYDYENIVHSITVCEEEEDGALQVFLPVLYSAIFLLGVAGNGLMITVLLRRRCLLRITEIYLLHLALADLMLLLTFPFDVAESAAGGWLFGVFLCKWTGLLRDLNLHCGSLLLACIGFDRYLAIVHAIPSMQSRRPRTVHLTCVSLWLVCLGLSVPNAVFLSVGAANATSRLTCSYHQYGINANNWVLTSRVLDHVSFFLPLAVMSYCYAAVVVTLSRSQKSQAKRGAIRLALLVTLVFFFCWLPYNIALLVKTLVDLKVILYKRCDLYVLLIPSLAATKSLGLSHCCLNPFLYAFVGIRFRRDLIRFLGKMGCGRVCQTLARGQGQSRPSVSDAATTTSTVLI